MKALLAKQKMINKVILIPEYKIKPNPYQPRKVFDDDASFENRRWVGTNN